MNPHASAAEALGPGALRAGAEPVALHSERHSGQNMNARVATLLSHLAAFVHFEYILL